MTPTASSLQAFRRVLAEDLRQPVYLTSEEVRGAWCDLFPDLASCLPAPYPIFGTDEERIITYGYPILISDGMWKLKLELDRLIAHEAEFRVTASPDARGDKDQIMVQRDRYRRSLATIIENVLMNDYGRGLLEVFLLSHSGDVVRSLSQVPKTLRLHRASATREEIEQSRQSIAGIIAELIQRAAATSVENLKQLADRPTTMKMSPLLDVICQDRLLLTETQPPADLENLAGYLRHGFHHDAAPLVAACTHAMRRLQELMRRQPEIGSLLNTVGAARLRLDQPRTMLEPRLLDALTAASLVSSLDLAPSQVEVLRDLGLRLKASELLATLRRRIRPMERQGSQLVLAGALSATPIAPSTRPFDFASPGVVESLVRRCGLVYDLTNFTAVLEAVRKEGQAAEEKALQFMYAFQNRLEEIRQKRVLNFEKFLGDGALYSSRRAIRVLAAACEIQRLYDNLRHSGFPFNQGIRIALNFGTYRLLPMLYSVGDSLRFEFFGHGIVELARLTTGKSSREVEEIAEFLVHAGYNPTEVDTFLAPLIAARTGHRAGQARPYAATIDVRGELINEGIVLTLPFLHELGKELETPIIGDVEFDDLRWAAFAVEPDESDTLYVGLRHLGVARLKGLSPQELVEAVVWEEPPPNARPTESRQPLIELLRQLSQRQDDADAGEPLEGQIPEDLLVVSYRQPAGGRQWIFGEYRYADDVVLHAIQVPIQAPDGESEESIETWLFRNRLELVRLYEGLRRSTPGQSTPLEVLRNFEDYTACFLAAPHRSPD
jgi:hypothetical protein